MLAADHAGIEINHIAFENPSADPDVNTAFLENSLNNARYNVPPLQALAS
jgi:hypothetical protein